MFDKLKSTHIIAGAALLSAVLALYVYKNNKDHQSIQRTNLKTENELTKLQLLLTQHEAKQKGVI